MLYTQAAQPTATEGGTPAPQRQWKEWVHPVHWGNCQVSSQKEI